MEQVTLLVEGMSCGHCVKAIESSVGKLAGVASVTVDLAEKKVDVQFEDRVVSVKEIADTIEDQGFDVK